MLIFKRLNWEIMITGVLAVTIVAVVCPPREINGENTMGGCRPCNGSIIDYCRSLEGEVCTQILIRCIGYNVN